MHKNFEYICLTPGRFKTTAAAKLMHDDDYDVDEDANEYRHQMSISPHPKLKKKTN